MRSANFRDDVLYALAYKLGLDPINKELLDDEAEAFATFINEWVRRSYDSADWPEWTQTLEFEPDANHFVSYNAFPVAPLPTVTSDPPQIGRPLKVYLCNPMLTGGPLDTSFKMLAQGIHVGFDHGDTVFIKFVPRAPKFTARKWDGGYRYSRNEVVYSPKTGECYRSRVFNNVGHDPTVGFSTALNTEILQPAIANSPGLEGRPQKVDLSAKSGDPITGTVYTIEVKQQPSAGTAIIGSASYTAVDGDTLTSVLTQLQTMLAAQPGLASFNIFLEEDDPTAPNLCLEDNSNFIIDTWTSVLPVGSTDGPRTVYNQTVQAQAYIEPLPAQPGQQQIASVIIGSDQGLPNTNYTVALTDSEGAEHTISYDAGPTDGMPQILAGLVAAQEGSADPFFQQIYLATDTTLGTMAVGSITPVSVDATMTPVSSAYWEEVLFPLELVEPVVRGAYSDALRSEGQTDKGQAEEQGADAEQTSNIGKAIGPPYDVLTDQQRPAPRYTNTPPQAAAAGR